MAQPPASRPPRGGVSIHLARRPSTEPLETRTLLAATLATLATFDNTTHFNQPSPPILDIAGNLYGTTEGGSSGNGMVFELAAGSATVSLQVNNGGDLASSGTTTIALYTAAAADGANAIEFFSEQLNLVIGAFKGEAVTLNLTAAQVSQENLAAFPYLVLSDAAGDVQTTPLSPLEQ